MNNWQPIETAPKDGTDFLACWDNDELHVVCIRNGECYRAMDKEPWAMPTRWMPLPDPPDVRDDDVKNRPQTTKAIY